ncbi:NIN-like protein [Artemisia annua]|uniref:NIN-like protein n=1 Tax=Artemisia annua TaxID=35608 RepID=A0A2U1NE35_ARTAN|nr:NIN-like protein [Artemisia annua]
MGSCSHLQSLNSSDEGKTLGFGSVSGIGVVGINELSKNISFEPPVQSFSGESRYLTRLAVFGNEDELFQSESAQPMITNGFELREDNINPHKKIIQDMIIVALKQLTFREQHVIVQFWSPAHVVGKHQVLTTMDQPFGLGVITEQLTSYRKESPHNLYVVDNDHEEEELSPPARVFRRRLPEWTLDVANYSPKQFPQKDSAIRRDLHGYLALPVVDLFTSSCVGVLEILTSSNYISYAHEIQQVQSALKTANLITTQEFDFPAHMQNELEKIHNVLKFVCDTHQLPLAQTWAMSPLTTFASHDQILKKSCNSFHTRCLGKVCMSTAGLPYHVQDLRLWSFRKACKEQHLDKSCGFVGRALVSHGSCFCEDVTKLSDEEYPLVHYALMSELSSCFAIFLHSIESNNDYVLEFFLPLHREDGRYVHNLVHTLKHSIEITSGFELGDTIEVVGPPMDLSANIEPDNIQTSSYFMDTNPQSTIISSITTTKTKILETVSSDSELIVADVAKTNYTHVVNQLSPTQDFLINNGGTVTSTEIVVHDDVIRDDDNTTSNHDMITQITSETITDAGEKSNRLKRGRKRKIDSLSMEVVKKHFGKPIDEAAKSLGVSRSTLKRFCRDNNMTSWPLPKHNKKTARITDSKLSQTSQSNKNLQQSSNVRFGLFGVVILLVRVKRWSCASKRHGFSGNWWSCGKHSHLSFKSDSIYQVARLMVFLQRWKNKKSTRHPMQKRDHLESTEKPLNKFNVDRKLPDSNFFYASPNQIKSNEVSDTRKVTVKATFKDDMIKVQIPISSRLFELQNEVARRTKLKSAGFRLKYKDEDDDLILLACDADLQNLLGGYSTSNNSTVKLIIQADD